MINLKTSFLALALPAVAFCAAPVKVDMKDAKGASVGTAMISAAGKGVKIKLNLMGLPPGEHAPSLPHEG